MVSFNTYRSVCYLLSFMQRRSRNTKLTAIAFAGVDDATIEFNTEFNVLTGVTAKRK